MAGPARSHGMRGALALLVALATGPAQAVETAAEAGWRLLKQQGSVALMRHADAPGTGDPAGFRLDDCATQRNLGPAGRAQATALGEAFRQRGIAVSQVLTSQWCRARETASLMALGPVADAPEALNSFFERRGEQQNATAALRRRLQALPADAAAVVMVTHQVNITALTGIFPRSGEIVVLARDGDGNHRPVARIASR